MLNYYEILNVPPNAAEEDIRKAYRELARMASLRIGDPGPIDIEGHSIRDIREAWLVLGDHRARKEYHLNSDIDAWIIASGFDQQKALKACESRTLTKSEKAAKKAFHEAREAFQAERFNDALRPLLEAIKLDHNNDLYQRNLGLTYLKTGMPQMACTAFEKAIEIDPLDVKNYQLYSKALVESGDLLEARKVLSQALIIDPDNPENRQLLEEATKFSKLFIGHHFSPLLFLMISVLILIVLGIVVWICLN